MSRKKNKPNVTRPATSVPALPPQATQMVANPTNDITIPHYSKVLRPQDETILNRGGNKGIALYREVLKDGRTYTVLSKRRRKLVMRGIEIKPASEARLDKLAAKICQEQLQAMDVNSLVDGLLSATLMGFSIGEIKWEREPGRIVARSVDCHDQRRFLFGDNREPRLLTWDNMAEGIILPERKFIVHRFEDLPSDPYGFGLGRILFWHVLFKREGVAFWMKALERFATPLPVAKYPVGSLPGEQQKLMDAIAGAIVEGALVVPAGTDVSFATAAVSGTLTHADWCRYWDEQTAETVLGQSLSTHVGSVGSKAAADTHQKTEDELIDGDGELLGKTFQSTILRWITEYNVPGAQPPLASWPRPQNVLNEEEAAAAKAERQAKDLANLKTTRAMGWAPANEQEHVELIMGCDMVPVAPPPPPPVPPVPGKSDAPPPAFADANRDLADDLDVLDRAAQPELDAWVDQIRSTMASLLAEGGSLSDLPDRLLALYPNMDTSRLTQILGAALTNADLRGRADVLDEAS